MKLLFYEGTPKCPNYIYQPTQVNRQLTYLVKTTKEYAKKFNKVIGGVDSISVQFH